MSSGKVIKEFQDLDLEIDGVYDILPCKFFPNDPPRRVKIVELDWEDAICEDNDGKRIVIWLNDFRRAEKIKIAGNWKRNAKNPKK